MAFANQLTLWAPQATPSSGLLSTAHATLERALSINDEDVKAVWEERFEKKFEFWRGFVDTVVARYLDCGVSDAGFARLRCDTCNVEK